MSEVGTLFVRTSARWKAGDELPGQRNGCDRRIALIMFASAVAILATRANAESVPVIKVFKNPNCTCCKGWVEHLVSNGFAASTIETIDMSSVKARYGVPAELSSCHTAEVSGYVVEGHVPAHALRRLLVERPQAMGLAVPGMPLGSPGMSGLPEAYEVVLFAKNRRQVFGRYSADKPI